MKVQNIIRAVSAGIVGTAVMTAFTYMAPFMGMPPMDIPQMLSGFLGVGIFFGWVMHFAIGSTLALIYSLLYNALPFTSWKKGAVYGLIPWFAAQIMVMPMMGMEFFSGSIVMAMGSLVGHLVYGAVVGLIYQPSGVDCAGCEA